MHIYKRTNTYYYRLRIPNDLHEIIQVKEIRFSLKTSFKRDAIATASIHTSNYNTFFSQVRSGIFTDHELLRLINNKLYQNLSHLSINRLKNTLPKVYTVNELSIKYYSDKLNTNCWTEKTYKAYLVAFNIFTKIIDINDDIKMIKREDLQKFKSILIDFPILKSNQYHLSIDKILKLKQKTISVSTANKYLGYIVSFFKWCEQEGYINKGIANGLSIKENKSLRKPRIDYSIDDLNKLFNKSTLYTTQLNKSIKENPERILLPLIALYQGMRINEIAQLYIDDIRIIDGVYCIDINRNTKDKRLKNDSSVRIIPIHQKLIELGFIDYYKKQKYLGKSRLWSNLSMGLEGYSTNFRKWYGLFNRKEITKDKAKTFHSFRHTFSNTFRQLSLTNDIDHYAIKYLMGHTVSNDITVDIYTHGYSMDLMKQVLDKLVYDGINIDSLKHKLYFIKRN